MVRAFYFILIGQFLFNEGYYAKKNSRYVKKVVLGCFFIHFNRSIKILLEFFFLHCLKLVFVMF
jgi:hypothetical protein